MRYRIAVLLVLLFSTASLVSCATGVLPTVTMPPQVALDPNGAIYVISNRERERVERALTDAGLNVAANDQNTKYSLRVKIGRSRGGSSCGNNANVAYILNASGRRLMVIKGRGETGECDPNILDAMSTELAISFRR